MTRSWILIVPRVKFYKNLDRWQLTKQKNRPHDNFEFSLIKGMNTSDIIRIRLANQQIASTKFERPEEILGWLGAVQAQEFTMAKWTLGLRLKDVHEATIDDSFNEGKIL